MVSGWRPKWAVVVSGVRDVFVRVRASGKRVPPSSSWSPVVVREPRLAQSGTDRSQGAVLQERVAAAWRAYRVSRARGAEHHAARAALHLGVLEQQRGNTATARTAYQHVIDFGDAGVADQAAAALKAIDPNLESGKERS